MEKEFVPYELALELKELGFDEPCLAEIDQIECLQLKGIRKLPRGSMMYDVVEAPLFQQAFRWFRDNKKLRGDVQHNDANGSFKFYIWKWNFDNNIGKWQRISNIASYNTYEEAELECLRQLINLTKNSNGSKKQSD